MIGIIFPTLGFLVVAALSTPAMAAASTEQFALQSNLDHVWTMTAAGMVLMMQAGFLLLEAGHVRSKNSVNVAQKNLVDFLISALAFGAVGFPLMFGASQGGLVGFEPDTFFFGAVDDWSKTFFVFQLVFCGTAATIVSGAVAERMSMTGYMACTLAVGVLIYPVAGHWAWGGLLNGDAAPFLAAWGFIDFAGSTVVHLVGGSVALAGIIAIGPRAGKFDEQGRPRKLHGHSPVLATVGCLILWVGWIGFNGGSTTAGTPAFASIVMNTMIAGAAGGMAQMTLGRVLQGHYRPQFSINGSLAGLVSITAGCDAVSAQGALLIGGSAGVIAYALAHAMEAWAKLDDPLSAVSVHAGGGAWGTVLAGVLARPDRLLADSRLEQVAVQVAGVVIVFAWAFGAALLLFALLSALLPTNPDGRTGLRVSEEDERLGLNVSEHDAPMGTGILQEMMARLAHDPDARMTQLELDHGDEAYETTVLFNRIIANIEAGRQREKEQESADRAAQAAIGEEIADVVLACARGDFSRRLTTDGREGFMFDLSNGVNRLCAATSSNLEQVRIVLEALARGDLERRVEGDYDGLLADIQAATNGTFDRISAVMAEVEAAVTAAAAGRFDHRAVTDETQGFLRRLCDGVNTICTQSDRGLTELGDLLERLAAGDLTARMSSNHQGRFASLRDAVDRTSTGLTEIVSGLSHVADEVSASAQETARASESLVASARIQAQKIGSTVILLHEINAIAASVTEKSTDANVRSKSALRQAEAGQRVVVDADGQMAMITEVAARIGQAVERIGDIALQTRILALNAAVEAARAGGANAGFRIVADEIRSLAARTEDVLKEIVRSTEAANQAVSSGRDLVSRARSSLDDIVTAVSGGSVLVEEMATAGLVQARRACEADAAMRGIQAQVDDGLMMVETAASAAARLVGNAERIKTSIERFETGTKARMVA